MYQASDPSPRRMRLEMGEIQVEFGGNFAAMVRAFSLRVWGVTKPGVVTPGCDDAGPVVRELQRR
jgi:hypothetical protein